MYVWMDLASMSGEGDCPFDEDLPYRYLPTYLYIHPNPATPRNAGSHAS